jgi:uncharacterized coiled-coil protein SlyX
MNGAHQQVLAGIQKRPQPHDMALTDLAGIVQALLQQVDTLADQLCQTQVELAATQDKVCFLTNNRLKMADAIASIAYETQDRPPVDGLDWLDPKRGQSSGPSEHVGPLTRDRWWEQYFEAAAAIDRLPQPAQPATREGVLDWLDAVCVVVEEARTRLDEMTGGA